MRGGGGGGQAGKSHQKSGKQQGKKHDSGPKAAKKHDDDGRNRAQGGKHDNDGSAQGGKHDNDDNRQGGKHDNDDNRQGGKTISGDDCKSPLIWSPAIHRCVHPNPGGDDEPEHANCIEPYYYSEKHHRCVKRDDRYPPCRLQMAAGADGRSLRLPARHGLPQRHLREAARHYRRSAARRTAVLRPIRPVEPRPGRRPAIAGRRRVEAGPPPQAPSPSPW